MSMIDVSTATHVRISPLTEITGQLCRYDRNRDDYVARFYRLLKKWRAETAYSSSMDDLFTHSAFCEIVGMGQLVVPLVISELRRQPDALVGTLPMITGEDPVANHDRGDFYAMASAWIEWFARKGK